MRTIQVTFDRLPRELRRLAPAIQEAARKAMRNTAGYAVKAIRQTSRETDPRPRAAGNFERGWKVRNTATSAVVENRTVQAYFVELGRRPGPAPLSPFYTWARHKLKSGNLGSGDISAKNAVEKLAFLAWRKVQRKGYKPRFVVKRTMPKIRARLAREMKKALGMALSGTNKGRAQMRIR